MCDEACLAAMGIDAATVLLVWSWGFGTVILFWSFGFAVGVARSMIRKV